MNSVLVNTDVTTTIPTIAIVSIVVCSIALIGAVTYKLFAANAEYSFELSEKYEKRNDRACMNCANFVYLVKKLTSPTKTAIISPIQSFHLYKV